VKLYQISASRFAGWILLSTLWVHALTVALQAFFSWGKSGRIFAHVPPLLLGLMFALAICYFTIRVKSVPHLRAVAPPLLPIFVVLICKGLS
jgi:hypothetical protein